MSLLAGAMAAASGAPPAGASTAGPGGASGVPQFRVWSWPNSSPGGAAGPSGGALPTWQGSFSYGGGTYPYQMVGTNPAAGSTTTTVPVAILPLRFSFGGQTIDGSAVSGKLSASPLFEAAAFKSGTTQFADAMRRAEFWSSVSGGSRNYHVLLGKPSVLPDATVTVPAGDGYLGHGHQAYGMVSYEWFLGQLPSLIQARRLPASTLPIVLAGNVFLYQNGNSSDCCVYGFHGTYGASGGQGTYAYTNYLTGGVVPATYSDSYAASHEVAEWLDDPFVNNAVPRWVQPGSDSCFSNLLEIADPVEALAKPSYVVRAKGSPWHLTDTAGVSWFSHQLPSTEQNGKYSYHGLLASPSALC